MDGIKLDIDKSVCNKIDFKKLGYKFKSKPLLIGGMAMEYYGLRKSGDDIDFVVTNEDYRELSTIYPNNLKDLWGDLGVCIYQFEIWKTICLFNYDYLSHGSVEENDFLVISMEKLLFMKALAMDVEKCHKDLQLIVNRIRFLQHENI
ncbi:hypothetical protein [Ruminiclostridium cellobioparum]|uniref:Nucleotidyltransferase n=1 Tax=Ruminiclostridium cellobioparum subsp. termitidis CT1112 TaxID=1195236 RepID=S0FL30_RUMCE|nr:hypothetical protein [Ruminiclostridium cellobioparum]EMS69218.1 hypothetical protein CTER_5173 [Ruminiclostridium cellobioparum subsp. termitidis CT1112]